MTRNGRNWIGLAAFVGFILAVLLCPAYSCGQYATLIGNFSASNGLPSSNFTISFVPSQFGYIAGTGVFVNSTTYCGTSIDGSVVGITNPLTPTVNTASYAGGTLPAANYFVVYTFYTSTGTQTLPSPESTGQLTANGDLIIAAPVSGIPAGALGMDVYIATSSGAETYQGQTVGSAAFTQAVPLVTGASLPTTNNTVCKQVANDAIWPTGTGYQVSLADSSGNVLPGYPMMWQILGPNTTINLSNGLPYYHGVVTYPIPILASPLAHGIQSISGPLSLTSYNLTNVGLLGVGTGVPGYGVDVEGATTAGVVNAKTGFLINGAAGTTGQAPCTSSGTYIDSFCTFLTPSSSIFYQTVDLNGTAKTQRPVLNFTTSFTATDSASPAETTIGLAATGVTAAAYATPTSVTVNAAGQVTAITAGSSTSRTCVSGGCYKVALDGTIEQWINTGTLSNNTPTTISLLTTVPSAIVSIVCSDNGGRVQSGNVMPVGANTVGLSAPFTTFYANYPATGGSAYCYVIGY